jgi:predicted component of type VI protein secretion system
MDVKLFVEKGNTQIRVIRLRTPETLVGRSSACQVCIKAAQVSRRHCLLSYQDGRLTVQDLGGVNGTYLNGRRLAADAEVVEPGDHLGIGPLIFRVEYGPGRPDQGGTAEPKGRETAKAREVDGTQETALVPVKPGKPGAKRPVPPQGEEEAPDVVFELEGDKPWKPPADNVFRDIMEGLEE